ncbi:hypothetical protein [uncultured Gimesia sp.]|uniref:hypothetical protein n=1 Tax=uncultured Gimesia sp. TaxID=1678688 RepID=UPI00262277E6|nr:hypothetical protein [uncultured Gimesia sp.]
MITVAEVNDIDRLDNFRLAWRSLLGKTKGVTFAHSPEWLEHYWEHFGEGLKLRVLFITLGNKIIGIVPLVVKPVQTKMGTMRVLTNPLDGWGAFYGQIGPNPAATMVTAMRHIKTSKRDWDLIDFRYIDQEGHDRKRTSNAFKSVGFQGSRAVWRHLPMINTLETNWNSYLESRTEQTKQRIETAEQILAEAGHVSFYRSRLEDPSAPGWSPRWDLWSEFEQMDFTLGNQTTLAGGHYSQSRKLAFLKEIHAPAVRQGMARIDALFINHSLAVCAYGLQHAEGTDYLALGHRDQVPQEIVTALIARMIQQSINDGEQALNLASISPQLANEWKNQNKNSYRCSHFPITVPRSQVLRVNRWMQEPILDNNTSKIAETGKPDLSTTLKNDHHSNIELLAEAPQEWTEEKHTRTDGSHSEDRPNFRIVG